MYENPRNGCTDSIGTAVRKPSEYALIQIRGTITVCHDIEWLRKSVTDMTRAQEQALAQPWSAEDRPAGSLEAQLRAIVGLHITIKDIDIKLKLSQNRRSIDNLGAQAGLRSLGSGELADLMEQHRPH